MIANCRRFMFSSQAVAAFQFRLFQQLTYASYGNPKDVLTLNESSPMCSSFKDLTEVKVLLAPIHPADINTIQGLYPIKPSLPAIPGSECVAEVVKSKSFQKGDRVIVLKLGWGTWKEAGFIEDKYLYKVPQSVSDEAAATLAVNPCTAYRMLKDFVSLQKGDVVIQNGANSAVGQFVIQLCREWGLKNVAIVRNRPDILQLKSNLLALGADVVFTEEEFAKGFSKLNLPFSVPLLALNCVGGRSATELCRSLKHGGTMVTYGGMSKQPVTIPTALLIFKEVKCFGFWMSRWKSEHEGNSQFSSMLDDLTQLINSGRLKLPKLRTYPLAQWREAIDRSMTGFSNEKIIFSMR